MPPPVDTFVRPYQANGVAALAVKIQIDVDAATFGTLMSIIPFEKESREFSHGAICIFQDV